jgi:HTH-type transcriptional regulator/antitoxin MqsA
MNMNCPNCEKPTLVKVCRDMPYTYKGEKMVLSDVTGEWCPACGEALLDETEASRISRDMTAFNKKVNSELFSAEEITAAREKLRLTQQEAAALFGGGINAFSRYENGKTKPPVALVKLLRLLEKYPDLLEELR